MEEEEKDSIEILKDTDLDINTIYGVDLNTYNYAVRTVLNLIKKQQLEFEDLKLKYEQNLKMCKHFRTELNKQNGIIDLMANEILLKEPLKYTNIEEVEKYFERKVEDGN